MKHRPVSLEDYSKYSSASNNLKTAERVIGARLSDPVQVPAGRSSLDRLGAVSELMPGLGLFGGHLHAWDFMETVVPENDFQENSMEVAGNETASVEGRLAILTLISIAALFGVPLLFEIAPATLTSVAAALATAFALVAVTLTAALVIGHAMQAGFAQYYTDEKI